MRRAAFGLLVASTLGGCNQIFGLDPTGVRPDALEVPADAAWATVDLGFLQLSLDAAGAPLEPTVVPFPDVMSVKIGSTDGPLQDPTTTTVGGRYTVPIDITSAGPYRLVYQRTGDPVPHEYQDLVNNVKVIEPLFGPVTRPPVTVNAGFIIKPAGVSPNHASHRVFTLGTWTAGSGVPGSGADAGTVDYTYAAPQTISLSGPLGLPAATDPGALVDYSPPAAGCTVAAGSSKFPLTGIMAHGIAAGSTWQGDSAQRSASSDNNLRLPPQIRPFSDEGGYVYREKYGFVPSPVMPSFSRPGLNVASTPALLRNPVMLPMRECTDLAVNGGVHLPRFMQDTLTEAVYSEVSVDRTIGSLTVTNGLALLTLNKDKVPLVSVVPNVAVADGAILRSGTEERELFKLDTTDNIAVTTVSGARTLRWNWNNNAGSADFWEVTLVELTGLVPVDRKTYTVTNAIKNATMTTSSVRIDAADIVPGKKYVFRISAFTGRPDAKKGDFARVEGNQQMSVVHTHSFIAQ